MFRYNMPRYSNMASYYGIYSLVMAALVAIAGYVVCAISLYRIGKRCGVKNAWLAFVPILQFYVIGSICEEYIFLGYRITKLEWILCALIFVGGIKGAFIIGIISFAARIFSLFVLHKFFYLFNPHRAMIYTVLSMLGTLPLAIILLLLRDTPIQMSQGAYPYPFANRP